MARRVSVMSSGTPVVPGSTGTTGCTVTVMEPGVSNIVSVSFHDVAQTQSDQELAGAIAGRRKKLDEQAAREPAPGDQEELELVEGEGEGAGADPSGEPEQLEASE